MLTWYLFGIHCIHLAVVFQESVIHRIWISIRSVSTLSTVKVVWLCIQEIKRTIPKSTESLPLCWPWLLMAVAVGLGKVPLISCPSHGRYLCGHASCNTHALRAADAPPTSAIGQILEMDCKTWKIEIEIILLERYSNVLFSQGTQSSTCREKTIAFNQSVLKLDISQPCRSQKTQNLCTASTKMVGIQLQQSFDSNLLWFQVCFQCFQYFEWRSLRPDRSRKAVVGGLVFLASTAWKATWPGLSIGLPRTSTCDDTGDRFEVLPARRRLNRSVAVPGPGFCWI